MPLHPTARILGILAEETHDLAAIARKLDALFPEMIPHIPGHCTADFRDLQRIDALGQHLRDISRVLKSLSTTFQADELVDIKPLLEHVRLEYFRQRLLDGQVKPDLGIGDGQPTLF